MSAFRYVEITHSDIHDLRTDALVAQAEQFAHLGVSACPAAIEAWRKSDLSHTGSNVPAAVGRRIEPVASESSFRPETAIAAMVQAALRPRDGGDDLHTTELLERAADEAVRGRDKSLGDLLGAAAVHLWDRPELLAIVAQRIAAADAKAAQPYWRRAADFEPGWGTATTAVTRALLTEARLLVAECALVEAVAVLQELRAVGERAANHEWVTQGRPLLAQVYFCLGNVSFGLSLYREYLSHFDGEAGGLAQIARLVPISASLPEADEKASDAIVPAFMPRLDFRRVGTASLKAATLATVSGGTVLAAMPEGSWCQFVLIGGRELWIDELNFHPRHYIGRGDSFLRAVAPDRRVLLDLTRFKKTRFCRGAHVMLGGAPNYYHWLFEYLPRLSSVLEQGIEFDGLAVNPQFASFQKDALEEIFGYVPPLTYLDFDTSWEFETLHVPAIPPIETSVRFLRKAFGCKESDRHPTSGGRLFVSRSDADPRRVRIEDEDSVYAALKGYGFERVVLSGLSFVEQVALFREASVIVGAHGAGLTNIVFSGKDCQIIEINNPVNKNYTFFEVIAREVGQTFTRLICPGVPTGAHQEDLACVVPIGELLQIVEGAINE